MPPSVKKAVASTMYARLPYRGPCTVSTGVVAGGMEQKADKAAKPRKPRRKSRLPKDFPYRGCQVMAHGQWWFVQDHVQGPMGRAGGSLWMCVCAEFSPGYPHKVAVIDVADMTYRTRVGDEMVTFSVIEEYARDLPMVAQRLAEIKSGERNAAGQRHDREPLLADRLPQRKERY